MDVIAERWLPVPGYELLYEVSDQGRVRSLDREVSRWGRGATVISRGRILKASPTRGGYPTVMLCGNGPQRRFPIHRLVATVFIPRPDADEPLEVCHNDGDPLNPAATNLRWDTRSANHRDKRIHGTDYNALKTHCKFGHPFEGDNLYVYKTKNGWNQRKCVTCANAAAKRRKEAKLSTKPA